jgi:hypothetical protein
VIAVWKFSLPSFFPFNKLAYLVLAEAASTSGNVAFAFAACVKIRNGDSMFSIFRTATWQAKDS